MATESAPPFYLPFMAAFPIISQTTELSSGWMMQDGNKVGGAGGSVISTNSYATSGWYPIAAMPSTVLAALVENKVYADPFYGRNLNSITALNNRNWWFRTTFSVPAGKNKYWLIITGITPAANLWVNGAQVAGSTTMKGLHNKFVFDITQRVTPGTNNTAAIEIVPSGSLFDSWVWVDWNPNPPDKDIGVWNRIFLKSNGNVDLRNACVLTDLPLPSVDYANLTVLVDLVNGTGTTRNGTLRGEAASIGFTQEISLGPNETRTVVVGPLRLNTPRLWWPNTMGDQPLYRLSARFEENGAVSDSQSIAFGVREYEKYLSSTIHGYRWFGLRINGKNVLVRGAAYRPDMLLRQDAARDTAEVRYWKEMGWNAVRFEGSMGNERIYDLCDRYGIMLEPGWCCCSRWEDIGVWSADKLAEGEAMMRATGWSLRHHAGAAIFCLGSDLIVGKNALDMYHRVMSEIRWPGVLTDQTAFWTPTFSEGSYECGIHMRGPYDVGVPAMWWIDTYNGAIGSCAEHSSGGCIPMLESVKRFLPSGSIWPLDGNNADVSFHTNYRNLNLMRDFINTRYGNSGSSEEFYDIKAQLYNYESVRAQYEAFGAKKFTEAFHSIYWMGNNAWPGFKWQLYDYYLKPTAGYFGFRKATQPWAIMLNLHTNDVIVVNSTLTARNGLKATARLYSIAADGTIAQSGQAVSAVNLSIAENAWTKAMNLTSAMSGLSLTYLVRLNLSDADNPPVCDNLYWYSTQKDVLGSTDGGVRAWTQVADCTLLGKLRTTDSVSIIADGRSNGGRDSVDITILNADKTDLAFFMRAEITRGNDGNEVLPAFYSDNYFSLWPGESKTITVAYAGRDLNGQAAWIRLKGANVGRKTVAVRPLTSVNDVSKFNRSGGNTLKLMPFLDGLPQTKRSTPAVSVFYHLDGRRIRNLHVNSHYRTKAPAGIYFVQTPASGEKISSSPVKQSNNRD